MINIACLYSGLHPYAVNWYNAVVAIDPASAPTNTELIALSVFLKTLESSNDLQYLERFGFFAASNSTAAKVDLINQASYGVIGTPVFTSSVGYTFDGASALRTGFIASTSSLFLLNSACYGVSVSNNRDDLTATGVFGNGANSYCSMLVRNAGNFAIRVNGSSPSSVGNGDSRGLFHARRTNAANVLGYLNGANVMNAINASQGLPDLEFYVGARNNFGALASPTSYQINVWFAGSGNLDPTNFYNAFATLKTSLGF